jgi:hypothetical protein
LAAKLLLLAFDERHGAHSAAPAWALAAGTAGHTRHASPELRKRLQIPHKKAAEVQLVCLMHTVHRALLLCLLVTEEAMQPGHAQDVF